MGNNRKTEERKYGKIGSIKQGGRFTKNHFVVNPQKNTDAFNDYTQNDTLIFHALKDFTQYKRENNLTLSETTPKWTLTDNNGNDFEWENQKSFETNSWDHSRRYERIKKEDKSKLSLLKLKAQAELELMLVEVEAEPLQKASKTPNFKGQSLFVEAMQKEFSNGISHNKPSIEKLARRFGIASQNEAKELTELAVVYQSRNIIASSADPFPQLVQLYLLQPNLSHRTSNSILMMQYSTPAPISYLCGMYVRNKSKNARYYEPTAGNGLLTIALPYEQTFVNELDKIRAKNLHRQPFLEITSDDASKLNNELLKKFDGIICNPPFGKVDEVLTIDGYKIGGLEHLIAINALKYMKDNGRASIIVGGHTEYEATPRGKHLFVKGGINRYFLNYLYQFYNVEDIIPIDGHKLYSRQGTAFDTRIILINGRKELPKGFAYKTHEELTEVMTDFYELEKRIMKLILK